MEISEYNERMALIDKKLDETKQRITSIHDEAKQLDIEFMETHPLTPKYKGKTVRLKHNRFIENHGEAWIRESKETEVFKFEGITLNFGMLWVKGYRKLKSGKFGKIPTNYAFNGEDDIVVVDDKKC